MLVRLNGRVIVTGMTCTRHVRACTQHVSARGLSPDASYETNCRGIPILQLELQKQRCDSSFGIQPLSAGDCYVIPNGGEFNLSHCSVDLKVLEVREENILTPNSSLEREENKRGEL